MHKRFILSDFFRVICSAESLFRLSAGSARASHGSAGSGSRINVLSEVLYGFLPTGALIPLASSDQVEDAAAAHSSIDAQAKNQSLVSEVVSYDTEAEPGDNLRLTARIINATRNRITMHQSEFLHPDMYCLTFATY